MAFELVKNGTPFEFHKTALVCSRRPTFDELTSFVNSMSALEDGMQFWIGGCLNLAESLFGEQFSQLIPEGKETTYMVWKWVDSRVKPDTRRERLSFSHHALVASLLSERQVIFLDRAEAESLSVSSLRKLIAKEKGKVEESKLVDRQCPSCGWQWQEVEK